MQVILTGQPESGLYVIPSSQLEQAPLLLPQGQPMDVAEATGTTLFILSFVPFLLV